MLVSAFSYAASIPAKGYHTRTSLEVNPGGSKCFDGSSWHYKLRRLQVSKVKDALELGGTDPKSLIFTDQYPNDKFIWKPQLPISKGHFASAQNEVFVFHVDCLLELKRTPPATLYQLDFNRLQLSLGSSSKSIYEERAADLWDSWRNQAYIEGTVQYFWEGVHHIDRKTEVFLKILSRRTGIVGIKIKNFLFYLFGGTSTGIREYSQRDMLDYITGNWDRSHNQFYTHDHTRGTAEIIYLDHNHLSTNKKCKEVFQLVYCKFWESSIDRLRDQVQNGNLTTTVTNSLNKYEPEFRTDHPKLIAPLKCLQARAEKFLEYVDKCVEKHGYAYVFYD